MNYVIAFYTETPFIIKNITFINLPKDIEIIDINSVSHNNEIIYFDYLITDNINILKKLKIKTENEKAITNFYMQSSIENIFAISNGSHCNLPISEQLEIIINYIQNPNI